ncbi:hypothetical protein ABNG03_05875 [Halorubrum sp. RMP-47]|uniref:hypothetical protein n=1 Tax=Halorubrum miltondacostae TaxID=3076378 RepID=UPI003528A63A
MFDETAAQSESAFTAYLHGGTDQRVLTTLVEELFRVLDYTVVPVETWDEVFDTVIRKRNYNYPIHTLRTGKPSRTTLQQLTAAHTDSTVPHSILVSTVTPPSERTNRVAGHSGVRVIDQSELRELVSGVIARLSEPVHASGTETRRASGSPAKVKRLITKLEAACDETEALVERQAFADATKRRDTTRNAVNRIRTVLPAKLNQRFRERLAAVESRLADITLMLQTAYVESLAAGDSHAETAKTAIVDGDITAGLRACEDARSAYANARVIADHVEIKPRGESDETPQSRVGTVTQLEQQLRVRDRVQQAEATIESLAATVADTTATARDPKSQSKLHAAARAGVKQLNQLPDDITDSELEDRVAALAEQVERFESAAQRSHSTGDAPPPEGGTHEGSTETTEVIHTTAEIVDGQSQRAPIVLRLHEELSEDGRRTVFRGETLAGDQVQFDVWHRHSDEAMWEFDEWYLVENVRGQHWTVANGTGVTLTTTPTFTATRHEPPSRSEA